MRPCAVLLLLAALCAVCVRAQTPAFRIGGTLTACGEGSDQSTAMRDALQFYANYTNANGGVTINGTRHNLEIIMYVVISISADFFCSYNDARDPELISAPLTAFTCVPCILMPLNSDTLREAGYGRSGARAPVALPERAARLCSSEAIRRAFQWSLALDPADTRRRCRP